MIRREKRNKAATFRYILKQKKTVDFKSERQKFNENLCLNYRYKILVKDKEKKA